VLLEEGTVDHSSLCRVVDINNTGLKSVGRKIYCFRYEKSRVRHFISLVLLFGGWLLVMFFFALGVDLTE